MAVPFLDLKIQYRSIRTEVDEAIRRVVSSQGFVMGPEVQALEEEIAAYVGVPHAVGVASGTDALLLPLRALDPEPGDEVIVPAFTFFATAGAVWNAGFRPVFCDVDPVSFNVTADTLGVAWTERTRALIPVHLFGQMAPMHEIRALAADRGAFVLEDAAQAIGAGDGGNMAGAAGHAGAFSFFPTKNLGGFGDGGMVTTGDAVLAEKLAKLRVHGGKQMYHHEMVGTNSRLDALQAAVLRVKLRHLEGWAEGRRRNAALYDEILAGVEGVRTPATLPGHRHVYNQYTLRVDRRDDLRAFLTGKGIGSGLYYPLGLHLQECFSSLGGREGDLPVTERLTREVVSLPIFPELTEEQVTEVAEGIKAFYSS
ncbi:MAG: DegT/DnrJ/EryC1/StrS family aminotransferase [Longimicrobiales bacterium]